MKKTFPYENPPHKPPRVVASIKNDVRKYVKRERRKKLPEDVDFWDFDCRAGQDSESAETKHVEEVISAIDQGATENWKSIYIEILAKPGVRIPKTPVGNADDESAESEEETPANSSINLSPKQSEEG